MERFMQLAFEISERSDPFPNPKVGAVIVRETTDRLETGDRKLEIIIGTGYHKAPGLPHAEIEAIMDAEARGHSVKGATLYVTLEPCSHMLKRTLPCTDAIIKCGIARVVFAMKDPNPRIKKEGAEVLKRAEIEVIGPTDQKKGEMVNERYMKNIMKRPFVAIKMAMSIDGKTATRTGESKWITGSEAREFVQELRSEFDAVMVGAETIIKDDPQLTCRVKGKKNPYRIVVDGKLRIPLEARVFGDDKKLIVATCKNVSKSKIKKIKERGAEVILFDHYIIDANELMKKLSEIGINSVLAEGGGGLNASLLEAGVVDRMYLFIAPIIIGGKEANGVFGGNGIEKLKDAVRIKEIKTRRFGNDILLECWF